MIANDTSLADDHTCSMIDSEILANLCSGMDVNTRFRVSQFRNDSWNHGHLQFVQFVGHAVVRHRVHHRIAENDLAVVGGSRVVVEHGLHISI